MRQAGSRASQALWALMHQGSKYADRMPIGLESIIRNVSASTVKEFYDRWYHPAHMAVVVVGDFEVRPHVIAATPRMHQNWESRPSCIAATKSTAAGACNPVTCPSNSLLHWHSCRVLKRCTAQHRAG